MTTLQEAIIAAREPTAADGVNATILIVDDEPANVRLFKAVLGNDYRVLTAQNGPEALALLEHEKVDLVLLDIMMPRMSGLEVCRYVRARTQPAGTAHLPIILLTALSGQSERNEGLEAGADEFLTKPINAQELILRVKVFLKLRRAEQQNLEQLAEVKRLQTFKDDLLALILHDVRNPLSGVLANLQFLQMDLAETGGSMLRDVESALVAAEHMRQVVESILQVRTMEEGHLAMRREIVPFATIAHDAIQSVSSAARLRNVQIVMQQQGEPTISADRLLFRRAMENLLTNALKYSPDAADIEVKVMERGSEAVLSVADRGPGVPDDLKQHIFGKFTSVEARRGGAPMGFGLGLHLVQLVMQAHGGRGEVRDREGGGSVFELVIPAAAPPPATAA